MDPGSFHPRWAICGYTLAKKSGFRYELFESLRTTEVNKTWRRLRSLEEQLHGTRARTAESIVSLPRSSRHRAKKKLRLGKPVLRIQSPHLIVWNRLATEYQEAKLRHETAFSYDLIRARAELLRIIQSEDFREAVMLCSREAHEALQRLLAEEFTATTISSSRRNVLFTAFRYLQRFCARNEITSFFGPTALSKIDPTLPVNLISEGSIHSLSKRRTYFAWWATEDLRRATLDRACASDLEFVLDSRVLRRKAEWLLDDYGSLQRFELTPTESALLEDVDMAAKSLSPGCSGSVDRLRTVGLLRSRNRIPVRCMQPLDYLLRQASKLLPPQHEVYVLLSRFRELRDEFATTDDYLRRRAIISEIDSQFERVTGHASSRKSGTVFADRRVLHEDCEWGCRLTIGGQLARDLLEGVSRILELFHVLHSSRREITRQVHLAWFARRFGKSTPVSLIEAQAAIEADRDKDVGLHTDSVCAAVLNYARIKSTFMELLNPVKAAIGSPEEFIELDSDHVSSFIASFPSEAKVGAYATADVLLSATNMADVAAGRYQLVFGEAHGTIGVRMFCADLYDEKDELCSQLGSVLSQMAPGYRLAELLVTGRGNANKIARLLPLPLLDIEYDSPSQRSPSECLAYSDLLIEMRDDELVIFDRCDREPILVVDSYLFERGFGFIRSWGSIPALGFQPRLSDYFPPGANAVTRYPRVQLGRLVIFRREWVVRLSKYPYAGKPFSSRVHALLMNLLEQWCVPRHFFLRVEAARKPLYVDRENILSMEMLHRLLGRGPRTLYITEMLPGPSGFWMGDHSGRYCSELSCTAFRLPRGTLCPKTGGTD